MGFSPSTALDSPVTLDIHCIALIFPVCERGKWYEQVALEETSQLGSTQWLAPSALAFAAPANTVITRKESEAQE